MVLYCNAQNRILRNTKFLQLFTLMLLFPFIICKVVEHEFIKDENFTFSTYCEDMQDRLEISLTRILFEFNDKKLETKHYPNILKYIKEMKSKKCTKILIEIIELLINLLKQINKHLNNNDYTNKLNTAIERLDIYKSIIKKLDMDFNTLGIMADIQNKKITDLIYRGKILSSLYRLFIHSFLLYMSYGIFSKEKQYFLQCIYSIDYGKYYSSLNHNYMIGFGRAEVRLIKPETMNKESIYPTISFESKNTIVVLINIRSLDACLLLYYQKISSFLIECKANSEKDKPIWTTIKERLNIDNLKEININLKDELYKSDEYNDRISGIIQKHTSKTFEIFFKHTENDIIRVFLESLLTKHDENIEFDFDYISKIFEEIYSIYKQDINEFFQNKFSFKSGSANEGLQGRNLYIYKF